jgi:hypothetical protein
MTIDQYSYYPLSMVSELMLDERRRIAVSPRNDGGAPPNRRNGVGVPSVIGAAAGRISLRGKRPRDSPGPACR